MKPGSRKYLNVDKIHNFFWPIDSNGNILAKGPRTIIEEESGYSSYIEYGK